MEFFNGSGSAWGVGSRFPGSHKLEPAPWNPGCRMAPHVERVWGLELLFSHGAGPREDPKGALSLCSGATWAPPTR